MERGPTVSPAAAPVLGAARWSKSGRENGGRTTWVEQNGTPTKQDPLSQVRALREALHGPFRITSARLLK
jgi:hypothetical protein